MIAYAILDGHGCVSVLGAMSEGAPLPAGAVEVPEWVTVRHHLVGDEWLERPVLPAPTLVGNHLTWAGLPPGTVLKVEDVVMADMIVETEDHDLIFTELGSYVVRAEPPAPWLGADVAVEVASIPAPAWEPLVLVTPDDHIEFYDVRHTLPTDPRHLHYEFDGFITELPASLSPLVRCQNMSLNFLSLTQEVGDAELWVFGAQASAPYIPIAWSPTTRLQIAWDMHVDGGLPGGAYGRLTLNGVLVWERLEPMEATFIAKDDLSLFRYFVDGTSARVARTRLSLDGQVIADLAPPATTFNDHPAHKAGTFQDAS